MTAVAAHSEIGDEVNQPTLVSFRAMRESPPEYSTCTSVEPPSDDSTKIPPANDALRQEDSAEDDYDLHWGVGKCQPRALQFCNDPRAFLISITFFAFTNSFVISGINNVNTSTLERRFELTSTEVSLISIAYEAAAAIMVLPISYFGAHMHQPRLLSVAAFFGALGSFTLAIPHFTTGLYDLQGSVSTHCVLTADNDTTTGCEEYTTGLSRYLGVFIVGMALHGVAGTTLYTAGIAYIDDNASTKNSPLYLGFFQGISAVGPAAGYLLGGYLINAFYVDVDAIDVGRLDMSPSDPGWVGAWWIGFLISGSLYAVSCLLLLPFPRELPTAAAVKADRISQAHANGAEMVASKATFGTSFRDFPTSFKLLCKNPVYMLITFAVITEGIAVSGLSSFLAKFIQNQFNQTAGTAAIISGFLIIPGTAGGEIIGGLIVRQAGFKVRGMLRMCIFCSVISIFLSAIVLAHCRLPPFAGINIPYGNSSLEEGHTDLIANCNQECQCTRLSYEPMCGSDGIQYFSSCHAGCDLLPAGNGTADIFYVNCRCITPSSTGDGGTANNPSTVEAASYDVPATATKGECPVSCNEFYVFLPFFTVLIFLTFIDHIPGLSATLRCIPAEQRSFALGLQQFIGRVFGSVPGPALFGVVFDSACLVWQDKCGARGSCWIYDNNLLSQRMFLIIFSIKMVSWILFILAAFLYKAPKADNVDSDKEGDKDLDPDNDPESMGRSNEVYDVAGDEIH